MTNLLPRNENFVTVHNKWSTIPPSTSVHFATRVRRSRVVRLSWSSRFFIRAAASKTRASNWSGVSTIIHPTPQIKKKQRRSIDSNNNISVTIHNYTYVRMNYCFSEWSIPSSPKIMTFRPETLCINSYARLDVLSAVSLWISFFCSRSLWQWVDRSD